MLNSFIDKCQRKCLEGQPLSKKEIISLLEIPVGSEADMYMRSRAREAAQKITGNNGCIWCAVGMDYAPCPMNCKFCSFGEQWGLIKDERHVSEQEILEHVRRYVEGGAAYIVLRTTEFYSLDMLLEYVPKIRNAVKGDYAIVLNTGELDSITAQRVADAGVYGVYHALRFREGQDTPFNPDMRISTMQCASQANLNLTSLVEPLGKEHSNEEIADLFLNALRCGVKMCGVMARFPVEGTPYGDAEMLDDEHIAHVIAALRLSGGTAVRDICVHPASAAALESGANVMVVEMGAIPRDSKFSDNEWYGIGMENARNLLTDAGYRISPPPAKRSRAVKKCPCEGGNLEKFMQPIILHILDKCPHTGYSVCKKISLYVTYGETTPDMAATYRYLKIMEKRGLLKSEKGIYSITDSGRECLMNWKKTLKSYQKTLTLLSKQLDK